MGQGVAYSLLRPARASVLISTIMLAACTPPPETQAPTQSATAPPERPARITPPAPEPDRVTAHFATLEQSRLAQGLLRQDRAPRDLPVTARIVEEAFVRIALFNEYTFEGNRIIERPTPAPLRRWQVPVRMALEFGPSVSDATKDADRSLVTGYAARLGRLTGHPVSMGANPNFHIFVVNEEERRALPPRLEQLVPGLDQSTRNLVRDLPLGVSCLVLAFSRSGTNSYTDAIAIIRAELPDLSRRACYYEELAQGMGLPNDSPRVRPSLFNDTAEFGVLTVLDENLLQVLYDPRLRPGMREAEARPIIRRIASELMGGES